MLVVCEGRGPDGDQAKGQAPRDRRRPDAREAAAAAGAAQSTPPESKAAPRPARERGGEGG